jgi:hypothetical protein
MKYLTISIVFIIIVILEYTSTMLIYKKSLLSASMQIHPQGGYDDSLPKSE